MSLSTNNCKTLILINLFVASNLLGQTNQLPANQSSQTKPCKKKQPKKNVEHKVIEIKSEAKLQELLSNNKMVVIEFYKPDCGACTMFRKKYAAIAKKHPEIVFAKINGLEHQHLIHKYHISGLPSFVFIFNNGNPIKTVVGPHQASIEKAIQELIQFSNTPAPVKTPTVNTSNQATVNALITELTTLAELEALIAASDKLVVANCHATWCGHCKTFGPLFNELASEHSNDAVFVKIDGDKDQGKMIAQKHRITGYPTTLIFKDKKSDQPFETVVGANKAEIKKAILNAAPTTPATPAPAKPAPATPTNQ